MSKNIMVDLETWGVKPGTDIRSIGAVVFDPIEGALEEEFYLNLESGESFGLTRDPSTVAWWKKQSAEAQDALEVDQVPFKEGLKKFSAWWRDLQGGRATFDNYAKLWANGSHFDYVLLNAAYDAVHVPPPWLYRAPRDCKTIWDAAGGVEDIEFIGTPHNALDDAKHQARCVIEAYRKIMS